MLQKLKTLLGVDENDTSRDSVLQLIVDNTKARLKTLLGGDDPPPEMEYIILEVAVIRFNRIGSEGLASHTVEGESMSFANNDFAAFTDEIQRYLDSTKSTASNRGGFRFL